MKGPKREAGKPGITKGPLKGKGAKAGTTAKKGSQR